MRTTSYLISDARSGRAISRMTAAPSRPSPPSTSRGLRRSQARSRGPLARGSRGSVPTAVRAPGRTCWAWLWAKGSCCSRPRAEGCNPTWVPLGAASTPTCWGGSVAATPSGRDLRPALSAAGEGRASGLVCSPLLGRKGAGREGGREAHEAPQPGRVYQYALLFVTM